MAENNSNTLPQFDTIDELVDYFDENDLGDHLEYMPLVDFEIDIQTKTHLFALDAAVIEDLEKIARIDHVGSARLINKWVKEKLAEESI